MSLKTSPCWLPEGMSKFFASVEGGDFDLSAEGGLGKGNRHLADQVIVVASEHGVRLDGDVAVEITGRRAGFAGFTLAGDANGLSFMYSSGNFDGDDAACGSGGRSRRRKGNGRG